MLITPKIRGFICTTAHPLGCKAHVEHEIAYVSKQGKIDGPKKVLVIGASTGYGLSSRIVAGFACDAATIGVSFERPAAGKRTASAGWYNTLAYDALAADAGLYAKSINGDAFSDEIRQETIDLIKSDLGQIDMLIYSLASPRRTDPKTNIAYSSALKTIGETYTNKTVNTMTGEVSETQIEPANEQEIVDTVKVMGGEDWALWVDALADAGVLADGFSTVAYSYVGPELTYPMYRHGTIGQAKEHLEATALELDNRLSSINGHAYLSVNKAVVTQSSAAIPVVPLYISLLFHVMKAKGNHEDCIEQIYRLFTEHLTVPSGPTTDEKGRIRIDDWEMLPEVQAEVSKLWDQVNTENLETISDIAGYREGFYRLFGFEWPGVDYDADVEV